MQDAAAEPPPPMALAASRLQLGDVALEPLAPTHRKALKAAADADAEIWPLYPVRMAAEGFDPYWARLTADARASRWLPFAVTLAGDCVGVTCFIAPDAENRSVEIGGSYLHPALRGGRANPASKRLMLGHAFESGARRVAFRVDALNLRSRAAVRKLGATEEGVMRQDRVVWTGRVRDTVIYSVLDSEWPKVRAGLDARLAAYG